ncbi:MAG TPA: LD-carboxypeptidase [Puia sp.]|jgi:muramoyltetrapeptide carboxypeptidase
MIQIPPYLAPGDTIALVCPAGYMEPERAQVCIETLRGWGYAVRVGKTMDSHSGNYFSGTDDERLADLQEALDDPAVKAILCGRGGYGLTRIVDRIDFSAFEKSPKWMIGFSDVTILHAHIYAHYKTASLHAPMAGAFNDGGAEGVYVASLRAAMEGKKSFYSCETHPFNRMGRATGALVGGNLSLLAHLCGTSSEIKTKGRILFLEDVGEYLYNLDRMLHQLKRNGRLARLAGLVIGGLTDTKDTTRPFGQTVHEIIRDIVREFDYPVCFNFPVSHGGDNYALKHGLEYRLTVGGDAVLLEE